MAAVSAHVISTVVRLPFVLYILFMNTTELLILNFEEVRRRSIKVWQGIPADYFHWKQDAEAMSLIETVRHVLECEWLYMEMTKNGGSLLSDETPFNPRSYTNVADEITFAEPHRQKFLEFVASFTDEDLTTKKIERRDKGYVRTVGDFLLRVAYHESVHAGQVLNNLRVAGVPRPNIWD